MYILHNYIFAYIYIYILYMYAYILNMLDLEGETDG